MHLSDFFNTFAQGAAPVAVAGLWQGTVVALAVALGLRSARLISASQRFVLWFGAFMAIAVLPLLPLVLHLLAPAQSFAVAGSHAAKPWLQVDARWTIVLAALWLLGSALRAVDLGFHALRVRRLWHTATPIESSNLPTLDSLDSGRAFRVCTTQSLDRPSVIGFLSPRVLIPEWLLQRLSSGELRQIVLHESAHLERRDDWTNLLQKICLVLFPLNPALWAIDRQLAKAREMACDEAVVHITRAPRAYAACLTRLAERGMARQREALSLGAWQRRSELVNRVQRILRAHRRLSPAAAGLLLGAFGCSLMAGSVELARCPQLVSFVQPTTQASIQGDAVYASHRGRNNPGSGARLIRTRAEMPPTPVRVSHRVREKKQGTHTLRASAAPTNVTERTASLDQPRPPVNERDMPRQFIVLTTWQQIETATPPTRTVVADYDSSATNKDKAATTPAAPTPAAPTAPKAGQPAGSKCPQACARRTTTFSQLILRIVPQDSNPTQPAAVPLGDGWFVIQL